MTSKVCVLRVLLMNITGMVSQLPNMQFDVLEQQDSIPGQAGCELECLQLLQPAGHCPSGA